MGFEIEGLVFGKLIVTCCWAAIALSRGWGANVNDCITNICTHIHTHRHIHIHTYTHTHTHTQTHIHIHTHPHTCALNMKDDIASIGALHALSMRRTCEGRGLAR